MKRTHHLPILLGVLMFASVPARHGEAQAQAQAPPPLPSTSRDLWDDFDRLQPGQANIGVAPSGQVWRYTPGGAPDGLLEALEMRDGTLGLTNFGPSAAAFIWVSNSVPFDRFGFTFSLQRSGPLADSTTTALAAISDTDGRIYGNNFLHTYANAFTRVVDLNTSPNLIAKAFSRELETNTVYNFEVYVASNTVTVECAGERATVTDPRVPGYIGNVLAWEIHGTLLNMFDARFHSVWAAASPPQVLLTEFLADNTSGLEDADGENQDWIELYNPTLFPVNLEGWTLTDRPEEPARWTFPAGRLGGHSHLIVFASGKDRAIPGGELHTNFKLSTSGGYLALRRPDGTVASSFGPGYPAQKPDTSYGLRRGTRSWVGAGSTVQWLVPSDDSAGGAWRGGAEPFPDQNWATGVNGIGIPATNNPAGTYSNLVRGDPGLVGYWTLGERSGNTVGDATGLHSGALSGVFSRNQPGALAASEDPDPATDLGGGSATIPDDPALNFGGGALTVEAWVQPDPTSAFAWIVAKESDNSSLDYLLGINPDGRFRFITQGLANDITAGKAIGFSGTNWFHVVGVQDPGANRVSLYVNGVLEGTAGLAATGVRSAGPLRFGDRSGGGQSFNGRLDEVAIYRRALTAAEIALHYQTATRAVGSLGTFVQTDVASAMRGVNASVYARVPFVVTNLSELDQLQLHLRYNDGFIAYLNGVEVAHANVPNPPEWNSTATAARSPRESALRQTFDLSGSIPLLRPGTNLLAIQGLNVQAEDGSFLLFAELEATVLSTDAPGYFREPTPGAPNGADSAGWVADPKFSVNRGFQDAPFTVALSCATPGATIRYTTDSSAPSETNGLIYSTPILISHTTALRAIAYREGYISSDVDTHTYLFAGDILRQPANPPGFPTTWAGVAADYGMDSNVVNLAQAHSVNEALRAIPSLCLNAATDDIFGAVHGIYANPVQSGELWERAASAELIQPDGSTAFQINCGLRLQGAASRLPAFTPKHSFRLVFKREYGATKLRHRVFPDSPLTSFDGLTLRAFYTDAWVANRLALDRFRPEDAQYQRDLWVKDTQLAMGQLGSHNIYAHLYVNGLYWGLFNISERPDAQFNAQYRGGVKEDYDVLKDYQEVQNGDNEAFNTMFGIANRPASDPRNISTPEGYADLQQYLDVPALIDYMMLHIYAAAEDWPSHNWYCGRHRSPAGKFLFYAWDQEIGLDSLTRDRSEVSDNLTPAGLYAALRRNAEFRMLFADRIQKHMFGNGALTPGNNIARYLARAAQIDQAVVAESARWGDVQRTPAFNRDSDWLRVQQFVLTNFFANIHPIALKRFITAGLYPSLGAPVLSQPGGVIPAGFLLGLSHTNAAGVIFYTLDGSDPRSAGTGSVAPSALAYSGPVTLNSTTTLRARVRNSTNWSALVEATFFPPQDLSHLLLTEIMYHPPDAGPVLSDDLEFLELKNSGPDTLDLSGLLFTSGISFSFTNGTRLAPGAFFVLARNPARLSARYPGLIINGVYSGKLDNGGETLTLSHPSGGRILEVTYADSAPWPVAPDGFGFSLVPLQPNSNPNPNLPLHWRASALPGGSPGADDPEPNIAPVLINELLSASDLPQTDAVELFNPTANPVNLRGWFLTDDPAIPTKFRFSGDTVLAPFGFYVVVEEEFNPTAGTNFSFAFNAHGDQVYLFSGDDHANLTGYSHGFTFDAAPAGLTFGRHVISTGEEQFPLQLRPSLVHTNSGPAIGPIVLTEILYHPESGQDEFVELRNITGQPVPLFDPANPLHTWRLNGLGFSFPTNLTLGSNQFLLLVATNPAAFRSRYHITQDVPILGPYAGQLQDSGERLQLQRPDRPDTNGFAYITVDEVRYNDHFPWPPAADGSGPSLQRKFEAAYGNDPISWEAATPTPGSPYVSGVLPTLTRQPQPITVVGFQDAAFSVEAQSPTPVRYQWRYNGELLPGQTSSTLVLSAVQPSQAGHYSVIVFNQAGSVLSTEALLTVLPPPNLFLQPRSLTATAGTTVTFSVGATGTGLLRYQWRRDGLDLPAATNSTLSITNVQPAANGIYTVLVTDDIGPVVSKPAILSVFVRPTIAVQPVGQSVVRGSSVTLSIGATGTLPLSYRWRRAGATVANFTLFSSNSFLTLTNVSTSQTGAWTVVVTNLAGAAPLSSSAVLSLITDTDSDGLPDEWESAFQLDPSSALDAALDSDGDGMSNAQEYQAGTDPRDPLSRLQLDVSVTAVGRARLEFDAVAGRTYTVEWKESADYGRWSRLKEFPAQANNRREIIDDPYPPLEGRVYRLLLPRQPDAAPGPILLRSPRSVLLDPGQPARLSAVALGTGSLRYQWSFNGSSLPDATKAELELSAIQLTDAGAYAVTVTDAAGVTTNQPPALVVVRPQILTQPRSQVVAVGQTATFSVSAAGNGTLRYQWWKDGKVLPGRTQSSLVLSDVTTAEAGGYHVSVSQSTPLGTAGTVSSKVILDVTVR